MFRSWKCAAAVGVSATVLGFASGALADDQSDAIATAKAQAEAESAHWAAVKAKADAKSSQATALTGAFPSSSTSGAVTTKDGAGQAEANYLVASLIRGQAKTIAEAVGARGKVTIFVGSDAPDLSAWKIFDFKRRVLIEAMGEALKAYEPYAPAETNKAETNKFAFAGVGTALTIGSKVLQLFSSDYEVGGVTISPDDYVLAAAAAGQIPNARIANQRFTVQAAEHLIEKLKAPGELYSKALAAKADLASQIKALDAAIEKDRPAQKTIDQDRRAERAVVSAQLEGVIAAFEDYLKAYGLPRPSYPRLTELQVALGEDAQPAKAAAAKADDKGGDDKKKGGDAGGGSDSAAPDSNKASLKDVLDQMEMADAIEGGAGLFLKVHYVSGSYYTKKNIWTTLDTEFPFYVAGSSVVSYSLVDGNTDSVVKSDVLTELAPYKSINKMKVSTAEK